MFGITNIVFPLIQYDSVIRPDVMFSTAGMTRFDFGFDSVSDHAALPTSEGAFL